jgi:NAD(P)-dependent dehydrogenase (short-subunit alcohol dehydrogenase family)
MTTPSNGMPVSLVTGANKGIDLETVRRLIGAGHRVYLAAREPERSRCSGGNRSPASGSMPRTLE